MNFGKRVILSHPYYGDYFQMWSPISLWYELTFNVTMVQGIITGHKISKWIDL